MKRSPIVILIAIFFFSFPVMVKADCLGKHRFATSTKATSWKGNWPYSFKLQPGECLEYVSEITFCEKTLPKTAQHWVEIDGDLPVEVRINGEKMSGKNNRFVKNVNIQRSTMTANYRVKNTSSQEITIRGIHFESFEMEEPVMAIVTNFCGSL